MKELLLRRKQVLFFIMAGGLCAVLEIALFKIFSIFIPQFIPKELNFHNIHYPISNIASTTFAIILNYFLSIWFVFERGKHSKKREFAYFMIVSLLSTILSLTIFQIFFRYIYKDNVDLKIFVFSPEILSKISAIVVVSVLNYAVKKRVIFNG